MTDFYNDVTPITLTTRVKGWQEDRVLVCTGSSELEWERFAKGLWRLRVPTLGWIVADQVPGFVDGRRSLLFVPDPDHTWQVEIKKRPGPQHLARGASFDALGLANGYLWTEHIIQRNPDITLEELTPSADSHLNSLGADEEYRGGWMRGLNLRFEDNADHLAVTGEQCDT